MFKLFSLIIFPLTSSKELQTDVYILTLPVPKVYRSSCMVYCMVVIGLLDWIHINPLTTSV